MFKTLKEDIQAFMVRDPAARSAVEIVLCYPGYHALMAYRMTHWMWNAGWRLPARFFAHIAKILTAVEIHPGATIGRRFVIDHGTGVVIGETADIGDDVTLYQGVTLGGIAPSVDSANQIGQKRHPTLLDGAIIGSGAAVLGPITIGEGAKVGANSVVTKSVDDCMTAVGIPARTIMPRDKSKSKDFVAYGTAVDGPDPMLQTMEELRRQISTLSGRIEDLEGRQSSAGNAVVSSSPGRRRKKAG